MFSTTTLNRIHDAELKLPANADCFTTAELIERVTKAIFSEVDTIKEGDFNNRKPAIGSLRRNLQRSYLRRISNIAMDRSAPVDRETFEAYANQRLSVPRIPDDCQTVAFAELESLKARIDQLLKSNVKFDSYSRAHLQESSSRIQKVLDARLALASP